MERQETECAWGFVEFVEETTEVALTGQEEVGGNCTKEEDGWRSCTERVEYTEL